MTFRNLHPSATRRGTPNRRTKYERTKIKTDIKQDKVEEINHERLSESLTAFMCVRERRHGDLKNRICMRAL